MIDDNLCVIVPARGGSKGIPGKNIKFLGQEPRVNWAIKIAFDIQSVNPSNVYLSTDCSKIMEIGKKCGAKVIERPSSLAQDKSTVISMITNLNTVSSPITPYVLSGAVYVFDVNSYMTQRPTGIYFGNRGHVIQTSPHVDIDEPFDLEKAQSLLHSLHGTYWDSLKLL